MTSDQITAAGGYCMPEQGSYDITEKEAENHRLLMLAMMEYSAPYAIRGGVKFKGVESA